MKTNTFIFNFINPGRLVYLLNEMFGAESRESLDAVNIPDALTGLDTTSGKTKESGKKAAEAAKQELRDPWAGEEDEKAGSDIVAINDIVDPWGPTKGNVEEIFKDKGKRVLAKRLLEEFTREGYSKGKSAKYNFEVISILGKQNESPANKDKWVRAFQEWVGATPDGATGPKTILALAAKVGESGLGRKIEGTMIARRGKEAKEFTSGTVTKLEESSVEVDMAKLKSEAEREAQYAALGMPNPLGENEEIPVTKVTRAETYTPSPVEKEEQVTLTAEAKENMELEKDLASLTAEDKEEQSVPYDEETAVAQLKNLGLPVPGEEANESTVTSAEPNQNRPEGTYYNPENPDEGGSYAANKAPEGWVMMG